MSDRYKKLKTIRNLFAFLHFIFLYGPLIAFTIYGITTGQEVEKFKFTFSVFTALMLGMFSVFMSDIRQKMGLQKTIMWVLILGIIYMLNDLRPFIQSMAVASILDEVYLSKKYKRYCELCRINKEITINAKE